MKYFNIYTFAAIVSIITCIVLGWFVYSRGKDKPLNRSFVYITIFVGFWCFFPLLTSIPESDQLALFLGRVAYLAGVYSPTLFLNFVIVFSGATGIRKMLPLGVAFGISTIFAFSVFSGYFMKGVIRNAPFFAVVPGVLYDMFVIFFLCVCCFAFYLTIKCYAVSDARKKLQLKYIILAFVIAVTSAMMHLLAPYSRKEFFPHDFLVIFYFSFMTYAIVRHQLMDIEVIIKKTLVFAGLLTSVFGMLILPTLIIQEYLFRGAGTGGRLAGLTISGIIIILTMRRIESFLIDITDKYLFQKKYDYKELLKTFTAEVLTVLELDKLVNLTINKLVDIVKLNSAAVLLFDHEKERFDVAASHNIKDQSVTLLRPDGIVTFMEETHGYILIKEMKEKNIVIPDSIQDIVNKLNAELIIPMVLHEEVIGVLSLGKKKSDEDYTQDDLDILLPLAKTLAIAISNAELFVELGRAQAEAAQREKMAVIGTLAAGMAHEIRNPITTIKVFAEFLKEKKDDPGFIEKFERIVPKEVEKINHMITALLEFSKPANLKSMGSVNIKNALQDVIEILGNEMVLKDIVLKEDICDVPEVYGNKKYIQEILFNLIENSVHAIEKRGSITINADDDDKSVYINIKDTGCGISEANIAHIFEPFFTTKMSQEGVGLGLYVIKQLMLRMKGSIGLESEEGRGTTFKLRFEKSNTVSTN